MLSKLVRTNKVKKKKKERNYERKSKVKEDEMNKVRNWAREMNKRKRRKSI